MTKMLLRIILINFAVFTGLQAVTITGDDSTTVQTFTAGTMTGNDGTSYQTVQIGTQLWMAENLKETKYRDGTDIPEVTDPANWGGLSTGARGAYNNDSGNESATYGYLYNWYAVDDSRNIAPAGWHVPSDSDYKTLEKYLGMSQAQADGSGLRGTNEGSKLGGRADLWSDGALDGNADFAESGFGARPAGYTTQPPASDYTYSNIGTATAFWTSTENGSFGIARYLYYSASTVDRQLYTGKKHANSVRLVSDVTLSVGLSHFSVRQENESLLFNWTTESETNNAGFILERKSDAEWLTVASYETHNALRGRGNTSSRTEYTFMDSDLMIGVTYIYRLSDVDFEGNITVLDVVNITLNALPVETVLKPAVPNPFNPSTRIQYTLAEEAGVTLNVINMNGQIVQTLIDGKNQSAGSYSVHWNGKYDSGMNAPSGIYLLVMKAGQIVNTQKVMLLR